MATKMQFVGVFRLTEEGLRTKYLNMSGLIWIVKKEMNSI